VDVNGRVVVHTRVRALGNVRGRALENHHVTRLWPFSNQPFADQARAGTGHLEISSSLVGRWTSRHDAASHASAMKPSAGCHVPAIQVGREGPKSSYNLCRLISIHRAYSCRSVMVCLFEGGKYSAVMRHYAPMPWNMILGPSDYTAVKEWLKSHVIEPDFSVVLFRSDFMLASEEMSACKRLRKKHFHGVLSGNQHPYLLKSRYGKVGSNNSAHVTAPQ
jgi:hypothetical protein